MSTPFRDEPIVKPPAEFDDPSRDSQLEEGRPVPSAPPLYPDLDQADTNDSRYVYADVSEQRGIDQLEVTVTDHALPGEKKNIYRGNKHDTARFFVYRKMNGKTMHQTLPIINLADCNKHFIYPWAQRPQGGQFYISMDIPEQKEVYITTF